MLLTYEICHNNKTANGGFQGFEKLETLAERAKKVKSKAIGSSVIEAA